MLKSLSETNKAYIAGFLDADGSIYVRAKPNSTYRYGFQIAPYIAFYQSNKHKEKFLQVCKIIGYGKTRQRKDGILEHVVGKINDIKELLVCIRPYVVMKKEQIDLMIEVLKKKEAVSSESDFKDLLKLIDSYRDLNYSKTRKIRTLTP